MGREHDPVPGQWYENLEEGEIFRVLSVDEDAELVEIQYADGDVEEIDYDTWTEMDLELSEAPEGWSDEAEDEELDEDEEDEDWDDEDEEEEDDDWDDEDDDDRYGDRDDY
jgi:hypothetical protein